MQLKLYSGNLSIHVFMSKPQNQPINQETVDSTHDSKGKLVEMHYKSRSRSKVNFDTLKGFSLRPLQACDPEVKHLNQWERYVCACNT